MGVAKDRCMETATTTGTGDITLAGAVTGYRTFTSAIGLSVLFEYCIEAVDGNGIPTGEWETGTGYLSGTSTLVRTQVSASSNANALVNFSAGTKRAFIIVGGQQWQDKSQVHGKTLYIALN